MIIDISFFEIQKEYIQAEIDEKDIDSDDEQKIIVKNRKLQPEDNVSTVCECINIYGFEIGKHVCNICILTAQIGFCIS